MYLNFFGFKKEPFHITPDPEFLYLSPSHKEALAAIIYGVEQKKGFVAVIGDVGVGKTTIVRSYLDSIDRSHLKVIYIFNARLTFDRLLKTIFDELGLVAGTDDIMEMVNKLYEYLIDEYRKGNNVVLVIDEAQNMPIKTLEDLRMLSNLETTKDKLIQIVLIGQNEFEEELSLHKLRQLEQRIAIRSKILPLSKSDSADYIKYRLQKAGANYGSVFSKKALDLILKEAKGIPRKINVLCDNALITAFGYQRKPVDTKMVREVISDYHGKKMQTTDKRKAVSIIAVLVIASGIFIFYPYVKQTVVYGYGVLRGFFEMEPASGNIAAGKKDYKSEHAEKIGNGHNTQSEPPPTEPMSRLSSDERHQSAFPRKDNKNNISQSKEKGAVEIPSSSRMRSVKKKKKSGDASIAQTEGPSRTDEQIVDTIKETNTSTLNPDLISSGSKIVLPDVSPGRQ